MDIFPAKESNFKMARIEFVFENSLKHSIAFTIASFIHSSVHRFKIRKLKIHKIINEKQNENRSQILKEYIQKGRIIVTLFIISFGK